MIKDKLENSNNYETISDRLKQGFEWLKNTDLKTIEDGRYYIDGDEIYANVQTYLTKDDAPFEAHRKYIDIQYMVSGEEKCGINDYKKCSTKEAYNPESDLEFLNSDDNHYYSILHEGEFLVFFPNDAHQPALKIDENKTVKKVIVKVAV